MCARELQNEVCWACDVVTPPSDVEWHHFIPKLNGGSNYKVHTDMPPELMDEKHNMIPLCTRCHNLIDRVDYGSWLLWATHEQQKRPAPPWAKLTMLKQYAIMFTLMRESAATA